MGACPQHRMCGRNRIAAADSPECGGGVVRGAGPRLDRCRRRHDLARALAALGEPVDDVSGSPRASSRIPGVRDLLCGDGGAVERVRRPQHFGHAEGGRVGSDMRVGAGDQPFLRVPNLSRSVPYSQTLEPTLPEPLGDGRETEDKPHEQPEHHSEQGIIRLLLTRQQQEEESEGHSDPEAGADRVPGHPLLDPSRTPLPTQEPVPSPEPIRQRPPPVRHDRRIRQPIGGPWPRCSPPDNGLPATKLRH